MDPESFDPAVQIKANKSYLSYLPSALIQEIVNVCTALY